MKRIFKTSLLVAVFATVSVCVSAGILSTVTMKKDTLLDKIKGGWAGQTIGCAYGGPTEFQYRGVMIPDSRVIEYPDGHLKYFFEHVPSLYDDIYMDLTFVEVFMREGLDAPVTSFAQGFAYADYPLWHANQLARYNIRRGIMPPASGHWKNNPHADCIDFQIEADFAGLMCPGLVNSCSSICDRIGHMLNYGDGWYGGVFVGAMYTQAFIEKDIETVVSKALTVIPEESKFYKCISDVIAWHKQYPDDWKKCWQLYNDKYSKDVGCPELILAAGNIDATMNSAYVVMGLLYGEEDFGKTMDIATRCGQDSDCNPATAAGVLATMIGYSNIPEKWMPNLREVEDITFPYVTLSLSKTYEVVNDLAIKEILRNGGEETDSTVTIVVQAPEKVKLEQSFPDMNPHEMANNIEYLGTDKSLQNTFKFRGKGVVVHGGISGATSDYEAQLEVTLDGKVDKVMVLCTDYRKRTDALYWNYELEDGLHTVTFKLLNPKEGVNIKAERLFYYTSFSNDTIPTLQPVTYEGLGDANSGGTAADFDNDGILDLFFTGFSIGAHVYKGTGSLDDSQGYKEVGDIGDIRKVNNFAYVMPCDFNLDGNVDLLAFDADQSNFHTNDRGDEGIFLGDGNGKFTLLKMLAYQSDGQTLDASFDWKRVKSADIADFNNDGLQDIVVTSDRIGYAIVFMNMGAVGTGQAFKKVTYDSSLQIRVRNKNKNACMGYVKAYDMNSDGYMDFVLLGSMMTEKAYCFLNNPENPGEFTYVELPMYRDRPSFDIADVNNDGLPDIYMAGDYSSSEGWVNRIFTPVIAEDGTMSFKLLCGMPWQNNDILMGWRSSAFVDWNGDGYADLIETGRSDTEKEDETNLDSRASKIRINFGDGTAWAEPILTAGSNANAVILTDVDNNGAIDYMRNGTNDLAVDIKGLQYGTGEIATLTVNPNENTYSIQPPVLNDVAVEDTAVVLSWNPAESALGNETYEYVVFDENGKIVAGTNMVDYTTGKRKALTAGNACQAKKIRLFLPGGKYTYAVQAVSTAYQGSAFTKGEFQLDNATAVTSAKRSDKKKKEVFYTTDGVKTSASKGKNRVLITSEGKKIKG